MELRDEQGFKIEVLAATADDITGKAPSSAKCPGYPTRHADHQMLHSTPAAACFDPSVSPSIWNTAQRLSMMSDEWGSRSASNHNINQPASAHHITQVPQEIQLHQQKMTSKEKEAIQMTPYLPSTFISSDEFKASLTLLEMAVLLQDLDKMLVTLGGAHKWDPKGKVARMVNDYIEMIGCQLLRMGVTPKPSEDSQNLKRCARLESYVKSAQRTLAIEDIQEEIRNQQKEQELTAAHAETPIEQSELLASRLIAEGEINDKAAGDKENRANGDGLTANAQPADGEDEKVGEEDLKELFKEKMAEHFQGLSKLLLENKQKLHDLLEQIETSLTEVGIDSEKARLEELYPKYGMQKTPNDLRGDFPWTSERKAQLANLPSRALHEAAGALVDMFDTICEATEPNSGEIQELFHITTTMGVIKDVLQKRRASLLMNKMHPDAVETVKDEYGTDELFEQAKTQLNASCAAIPEGVAFAAVRNAVQMESFSDEFIANVDVEESSAEADVTSDESCTSDMEGTEEKSDMDDSKIQLSRYVVKFLLEALRDNINVELSQGGNLTFMRNFRVKRIPEEIVGKVDDLMDEMLLALLQRGAGAEDTDELQSCQENLNKDLVITIFDLVAKDLHCAALKWLKSVQRQTRSCPSHKELFNVYFDHGQEPSFSKEMSTGGGEKEISEQEYHQELRSMQENVSKKIASPEVGPRHNSGVDEEALTDTKGEQVKSIGSYDARDLDTMIREICESDDDSSEDPDKELDKEIAHILKDMDSKKERRRTSLCRRLGECEEEMDESTPENVGSSSSSEDQEDYSDFLMTPAEMAFTPRFASSRTASFSHGETDENAFFGKLDAGFATMVDVMLQGNKKKRAEDASDDDDEAAKVELKKNKPNAVDEKEEAQEGPDRSNN